MECEIELPGGMIALPPSPNWYQTSVTDATAHNGGLLAYGAKNSIVVVRICVEGPNGKKVLASATDVRFVGTLAGHKDRVTTVAFCKNKSLPSLLVSGAARGCRQTLKGPTRAGLTREVAPGRTLSSSHGHR